MAQYYDELADVILSLHIVFVVFVVVGLLLIITGGLRRWGWVRNLWFRVVHLMGIGVVVAQAWLDIVCPLTTLEMWLRQRAGESHHQEAFIQHWLQSFLYYNAPMWVFVVVYTVFGVLVALAWLKFPPKFVGRGGIAASGELQ